MSNYQKNAAGTFKPAKQLTEKEVHLSDWGLGLGGEAGEVQDLIKHQVFHGEANTEQYRMSLAKELGDVLWYVAAIATTENMELDDIMLLNTAKLRHRYNGAYSVAASAERHEKENKFGESSLIYQALKSRICFDESKIDSAPCNFIFVGPDGAGKTTLVKALQKYFPEYIYHKCDYRQEDKVELSKELLCTRTHMLYDRFYFPDDIVYSMVKDGTSKYALYDEVLDLIKMTNTIIVFVDAPLETLHERSKAWADDYVTTDMLTSIEGGYIELLNSTCSEVYLAYVSNPNRTPEQYEKFVDSVAWQLKETRRRMLTNERGDLIW